MGVAVVEIKLLAACIKIRQHLLLVSYKGTIEVNSMI